MTPPPNPARRSEQARKAILDAAYELNTSLGYQKLTIEAMAARAGVGKQTIYRWWPSKGAVVLEAANERVGAATDFPDTGDVIADLRSQMTAVVALLTGPFGELFTGLIAEAQFDPALAETLVRTIIEPRIAACSDRLDKAKEDGQIGAGVNTTTAVEMLYGPLYYRLLLRNAPLTAEHMAEIIDAMFTGLAARSPSQP